ncbi:TPA: hypothetical protein ACIVE4_004239, partial [Salmonella enterica subsp. enterica serovar Hvittingfoss]
AQDTGVAAAVEIFVASFVSFSLSSNYAFCKFSGCIVMCAYLSQSGGHIFCTASTAPQRKLSPRASAFP